MKIDLDVLWAADANSGFCLMCGRKVKDIGPDAREYECEFCGERAVYGATLLLHRDNL